MKKYDIYTDGPFGEIDPRFIGRRIKRKLPDGTPFVLFKNTPYKIEWDKHLNGYRLGWEITEL